MFSARPGRGAALIGPLVAVLVALVAAAAPAGAQTVETSIDLNYTYEQEHTDRNVFATAGYQQKYQVRLTTTLTSSLDFIGALSIDLDDTWDSAAATTSKVAPSLELGVRGPQSAAKFTYTGTINKTREFEELGESTQYSSSADLDLELTPEYWPELKFKLQEKRDYELQRTDTSTRTAELQLRDDIFNVRMEFQLRLDTRLDTLPQPAESDTVDWSYKATYKESLFGGTDFEVAYEIKESYVEDTARGVFASLEEEYTQTLKARLKKSLELSSRLNAAVSWEYSFDQDLLELEFDHRVQNKYGLDVRYDVLPSLKLVGEAKRETTQDIAIAGDDDVGKVTDTLRGAFDFEPISWLRIGGKGELKYEDAIEADTGGSVDQNDDRQYELTLKNKWRDFWDLTVSTSADWAYTDGLIEDKEAKFKAGLKLRLLKLTWAEMNLWPTYEATRKASWDDLGFPQTESSTSDAKFKFEIKALLLTMFKTTFTHEYGQKVTEENDAVLDYNRELGFNETTRLNVAVADVVEGLNLEGEIERKADDTEDDAEEQVVTVTYALKLDWKYEDLMLSSAFKYFDRSAEEDDDVEFTAKIGWKGERVDISGDYQYGKTYADLTDENRSLNLKLSARF